MSNLFKLKDVQLQIAEIQAAVQTLRGVGNGRNIEQRLSRGLSQEYKKSQQHLRRLLHTFARDSDEAKEELERRGLMPEDPGRPARRLVEMKKARKQQEEERKRRKKQEKESCG